MIKTAKMKKNLIIVGSIASGKTTLANYIANFFKKPATLLFNGYRNKYGKGIPPFYFEGCDHDTDLIIVECETNNLEDIETFILRLSHPIIIEKRGYKSFKIEPTIVVTMQELPHALIRPCITNHFDFTFLTNVHPLSR